VENHVRILAILNIVLGALGLIAALVILAIFGGIMGVIGASGLHVDTGDVPPQAAIPVLGIIGGVFFLFLVIVSLPGIITGIGLLHYRGWARILGIVLSAISLPAVPFGTALGAYGLWVLLNTRTAELFANPQSRERS
jgi:hypothetical protein